MKFIKLFIISILVCEYPIPLYWSISIPSPRYMDIGIQVLDIRA